MLYETLIQRVKWAQRFVHIQDLKYLHIFKGVHKHFKNIDWEGLLNLHAVSYQTPMLELLSSIAFDYQTHILTFRFLNQSYQIHVDTLCDIIGAPKEKRDIYTAKGRKNVVFEQDCERFWRSVSCEYEF